MREIEGKEEVLVWHFTIKSEDLLLFGRGYGEEKERKRTLKDDSCKVLNLAFLFSY